MPQHTQVVADVCRTQAPTQDLLVSVHSYNKVSNCFNRFPTVGPDPQNWTRSPLTQDVPVSVPFTTKFPTVVNRIPTGGPDPQNGARSPLTQDLLLSVPFDHLGLALRLFSSNTACDAAKHTGFFADVGRTQAPAHNLLVSVPSHNKVSKFLIRITTGGPDLHTWTRSPPTQDRSHELATNP